MEHFLTVLIMRLIHRSVRPAAENVGGTRLLTYGSPVKAVPIVMWCIVFSILFAAVIWPPPASVSQIGLIVGAVFVALIVYMSIEVIGVSILYDDSGIYTRSPWRASRSVAWSEVTGVKYSDLCQWYVIGTTSQGSIRCHLFLNGTGSLLNELKDRGFDIPEWKYPPIV